MNYELAKQLKDAGFPQSDECEHCGNFLGGTFRLADEDVYRPTLSELIEACGDNFESLMLRLHNHTWAVSSPLAMLGGFKTPEEAVAKLWLALNKKQ